MQFVSIADYVRNGSAAQPHGSRRVRNSQFGTIDDARPAGGSAAKPGMQRTHSLSSIRLESKGLREYALLGTQGKRQQSNHKAFQTSDSDGYRTTIEQAEKFYQTVKPTDEETFNRIVDFTQDLDYQFEERGDERRTGQQQLTRPSLLHSGLNSTSHKKLFEANQSFDRRSNG